MSEYDYAIWIKHEDFMKTQKGKARKYFGLMDELYTSTRERMNVAVIRINTKKRQVEQLKTILHEILHIFIRQICKIKIGRKLEERYVEDLEGLISATLDTIAIALEMKEEKNDRPNSKAGDKRSK